MRYRNKLFIIIIIIIVIIIIIIKGNAIGSRTIMSLVEPLVIQ